ncbi:hypothetical protein HA466_0191080 [Hirschfeldia incana]|nr:hypothetical protein HA466_0191080 [Hirschfeldia incana]
MSTDPVITLSLSSSQSLHQARLFSLPLCRNKSGAFHSQLPRMRLPPTATSPSSPQVTTETDVPFIISKRFNLSAPALTRSLSSIRAPESVKLATLLVKLKAFLLSWMRWKSGCFHNSCKLQPPSIPRLLNGIHPRGHRPLATLTLTVTESKPVSRGCQLSVISTTQPTSQAHPQLFMKKLLAAEKYHQSSKLLNLAVYSVIIPLKAVASLCGLVL